MLVMKRFGCRLLFACFLPTSSTHTNCKGRKMYNLFNWTCPALSAVPQFAKADWVYFWIITVTIFVV